MLTVSEEIGLKVVEAMLNVGIVLCELMDHMHDIDPEKHDQLSKLNVRIAQSIGVFSAELTNLGLAPKDEVLGMILDKLVQTSKETTQCTENQPA